MLCSAGVTSLEIRAIPVRWHPNNKPDPTGAGGTDASEPLVVGSLVYLNPTAGSFHSSPSGVLLADQIMLSTTSHHGLPVVSFFKDDWTKAVLLIS